MDGRLRSTQCMEIPFVFNNTDRHASMTGGDDARKPGKIMSEEWLNFACIGKPFSAAEKGMPAEWPAYYLVENGANDGRQQQLRNQPLTIKNCSILFTAHPSADSKSPKQNLRAIRN